MTRLTLLRQWLTERQLDAVLISSRPNKQPHLGISSSSGFVLISHQHAHILVDARYYADVKARANGYCIHLLGGQQTLASLVNQIIAAENLQTVGFEGAQVSWETARRWQTELRATMISVSIDALRRIKTAVEIDRIREACRIADAGAEHIRRFIAPGQSEREIAAELEWFMRQRGAEKASFDTIVASGWRGALPHGKASDKIVAAGEWITLDFGALYQGYCSDMTRTFLVPGAGARCLTVDAAARDVIDRAGYGEFFAHNTGHSIGIEVHEDPCFSPDDHTVLAPGMLLTVEPGIYLPELGGVRIEDVVLVTLEGVEVLYSMPKTVLLTGAA
ncbi:aminopeptidase [Salmonella enterica]|nr:aminopeptidase [Salmonella enterica]